MSRIRPLVAPVLKMLALLFATAAAAGPLSVKDRAAEALFAATAQGKRRPARQTRADLADRGTNSIWSDRTPEKIQASRDSIATRLIVLEAQRELLAAEIHERDCRSGDGASRELALMDCAISVLKSTANRADRALRGANDELRARRVELSLMQAHDDARRMNQALARPIGNPALWSSQIARARVILGPLSTADHAGPILAALQLPASELRSFRTDYAVAHTTPVTTTNRGKPC